MTDSLLDELNRRSISVQQVATYLLTEYAFQSLESAYKAARLILLDAGEITSRTKLNKVLAEVSKQSEPAIAAALDEISKELESLAVAEMAFTAKTLSEFSDVKIKTTTNAFVKSYASKAIMSLESGSGSRSGVWANFTRKNKSDTIELIKAAISTGYSRGEPVQQTIKRVKAVTEGLAKNNAEALVRTGVQHYSQQANNALRDDNLDVLSREVPITTWDSRRSLICTSIEAKYGVNGSISNGWPVGKSPIGYNPFHFGCRTIIRALPEGVELEGERPAIVGKKGDDAEDAFKRKEKLADKRLESGGSGVVKYTGRKDKAFEPELIKVDTKLSKFLRDQPSWYTEKLLGKAKSDAFRSGKLDLSRLTDKNLKPLTVEQLGID